MAADDRFIVPITSVSATGELIIRPGSGAEAIIKNIFCGAASEVYLYDGTNSILIDSSSSQNSWLNLSIDITNLLYIRVKNISGSSQYMSAGGVQTK